MVEVLLQNGAQVNAAEKVMWDEWRDMIQRNACQSAKYEMQSAGMPVAMADRTEPMTHG